MIVGSNLHVTVAAIFHRLIAAAMTKTVLKVLPQTRAQQFGVQNQMLKVIAAANQPVKDFRDGHVRLLPTIMDLRCKRKVCLRNWKLLTSILMIDVSRVCGIRRCRLSRSNITPKPRPAARTRNIISDDLFS